MGKDGRALSLEIMFNLCKAFSIMAKNDDSSYHHHYYFYVSIKLVFDFGISKCINFSVLLKIDQVVNIMFNLPALRNSSIT